MFNSLDILTRNVKRLLQKRGWDQKDLAARAGMKGAQVSKYMRQINNPSLAVVDRLAHALGVSAAELVAAEGVLPTAEPHTIKECLVEVEAAALLGAGIAGLYRLPITLFLAFFWRSRRREKLKPPSGSGPS